MQLQMRIQLDGDLWPELKAQSAAGLLQFVTQPCNACPSHQWRHPRTDSRVQPADHEPGVIPFFPFESPMITPLALRPAQSPSRNRPGVWHTVQYARPNLPPDSQPRDLPRAPAAASIHAGNRFPRQPRPSRPPPTRMPITTMITSRTGVERPPIQRTHVRTASVRGRAGPTGQTPRPLFAARTGHGQTRMLPDSQGDSESIAPWLRDSAGQRAAPDQRLGC
jgi:hypothetical protein